VDTPSILLLTGALLGALALAAWLGVRLVRVVSATLARNNPAPSPAPDYAEPFRIIEERLRTLDSRVDSCVKAVAEGIDHVDRNEKRVRGILTGARNRFATAGYQDPGVEAEVESLPPVDDAPSPEEQVPAVSEGVELGSWNAVPGMSERG